MDLDDYFALSAQKYSSLPLRQVVLLSLKRAIITGKLKSGDRLMEIHIAEIMGVSRTPVREAIQILEQEGLVVMKPRHGVYVQGISEKALTDVLEVRRALEGLSLSRASRRIKDEELDELLDVINELEKIVNKKVVDVEQVADLDVQFHNIILQSTQNDSLIDIMTDLSDTLYRYRLEYLKDSDNYKELINEHKQIYDYLHERDEDNAVAAIQRHIDKQATAILNMIKSGMSDK